MNTKNTSTIQEVQKELILATLNVRSLRTKEKELTPVLRFQSVEQTLDYRESKWFVKGAGTLVEIIRCI